MKTVDSKTIAGPLNRCYMVYDPDWPDHMVESINGFKYYVEHNAGLRLDFIPATRDGKMGYEIKQVEIVDEPKFTMWLLRWS